MNQKLGRIIKNVTNLLDVTIWCDNYSEYIKGQNIVFHVSSNIDYFSTYFYTSDREINEYGETFVERMMVEKFMKEYVSNIIKIDNYKLMIVNYKDFKNARMVIA